MTTTDARTYIEEFSPSFTLSPDGWALRHCSATVAVMGQEDAVLRFMADNRRQYGCTFTGGLGRMVVSMNDEEVAALGEVMKAVLARALTSQPPRAEGTDG